MSDARDAELLDLRARCAAMAAALNLVGDVLYDFVLSDVVSEPMVERAEAALAQKELATINTAPWRELIEALMAQRAASEMTLESVIGDGGSSSVEDVQRAEGTLSMARYRSYGRTAAAIRKCGIGGE